jgi:hypothetical protein
MLPKCRVLRLTVVSPEDPDGVELLLEPDGHPAASRSNGRVSVVVIPLE